MSSRLLAITLSVGLFTPGLAQNAGFAGANGRGGIAFVTRRLPTSGVGMQAGMALAAGGVGVANVSANAGPGTFAATEGATTTGAVTPNLNGQGMVALRQLAGRGDRAAQQLLRESGHPVRPARR